MDISPTKKKSYGNFPLADNSFFRDFKINQASQMNLSISQIPSQLGQSSMLSQDIFLSQKMVDRSKNKDNQKSQQNISINNSSKDQTSSVVSTNNPNLLQFNVDDSIIDEQLGLNEKQKIKELVYFFNTLLSCTIHKQSLIQLDEFSFQINIDEFLFNSQCNNQMCKEICQIYLKVTTLQSFTKAMYYSLKVSIAHSFLQYLKSPRIKLKINIKNIQSFKKEESDFILTSNHNELIFISGSFESFIESKIYFSNNLRNYIVIHSYKFSVDNESQTSLTVFTLDKDVDKQIQLHQDIYLIGFIVIATNPTTTLNEFAIQINSLQQQNQITSEFSQSNEWIQSQTKIFDEIKNQQLCSNYFDSLVKNFFKNVVPQNYTFKGLLLLILVSNASILSDLNILFLCDKGICQVDLLQQLQFIQKSNFTLITEQENKSIKKQKNELQQTLQNIRNSCISNHLNSQKRIFLNCHMQSPDALRRRIHQKSLLKITKRNNDEIDNSYQTNVLFSNCQFNTYKQIHYYSFFQKQIKDFLSHLVRAQKFRRIANLQTRVFCRNYNLFVEQRIVSMKNLFRERLTCNSIDLNFNLIPIKQLKTLRSKRKNRDNNSDSNEYFQDSISSRIKLQNDSKLLDENFFLSYLEYLKQIPEPKFKQDSSNLVQQSFTNFLTGNTFQESLSFLTQNPRLVPLIIEISKARAKIEFSDTVKEEHIQDVIDLIVESFQEISLDTEFSNQIEEKEELSVEQIRKSGQQKQTKIFLNYLKDRGSVFNRKELRQHFDECGIQITGCFDDFIDSLNDNDYFLKITATQFQLNREKI